MNSKKLIVIVLFILTVLIGILTIYLAVVLTQKKITPTPTPTPYIKVTTTPKSTDNVTVTPTRTPVPTISITPTLTGTAACGSSCATTACAPGNICLLVSGTKKCVADICLDKSVNPPATNNECNGDLCTSKYNIEISKTAKVSCVTGQNQRMISFTIKIINPAGNNASRSNISVQDDLTNGLNISYLRSGSISSSGTVSGKVITWSNLSLTPSGGYLELKYDMQVPPAEYGKKYTNTVTVQEGGVLRGSMTYNLDIAVLPCTALSKDDYLFIVIGFIMIIFGMLFFRFNWHEDLGNLFWNNGGAKVGKRINKLAIKTHKLAIFLKKRLNIIRLELTEDKVTKFERKVSDRPEDKS